MYYGLRNASLTVRNMTVMGLIQTPYGKRAFQIRRGPAWITSEGFDTEAKAERPQKATHYMLKSLLASRFQLMIHRETKETDIYSLVVARGGLKIRLAADQTEPDKGGPKEMDSGRIIGEGIPIYVIANLLSNMLGRAVINNTGLTGKYDIKLQLLPDPLRVQPDPANPVAQAEALGFTIIEAVEKQLGLKLESSKAPGGSSGDRPRRASVRELKRSYTTAGEAVSFVNGDAPPQNELWDRPPGRTWLASAAECLSLIQMVSLTE